MRGAKLVLGLDGLVGLILALLLWLAPMNAWTYSVGVIALTVLICVFIWLLPLPIRGRIGVVTRLGISIFAAAFLAAFFVASGIYRFSHENASFDLSASAAQSGSPQGTINAPNNQGIITQGQTGGTNTINQAPKPEIQFGRPTIRKNDDGTYTETVSFQVISPYPPAQLYLQVDASGILSFDAVPQRIGLQIQGHSGIREAFAFVTLMQPFGSYVATVKTKTPLRMNMEYSFQ